MPDLTDGLRASHPELFDPGFLPHGNVLCLSYFLQLRALCFEPTITMTRGMVWTLDQLSDVVYERSILRCLPLQITGFTLALITEPGGWSRGPIKVQDRGNCTGSGPTGETKDRRFGHVEFALPIPHPLFAEERNPWLINAIPVLPRMIKQEGNYLEFHDNEDRFLSRLYQGVIDRAATLKSALEATEDPNHELVRISVGRLSEAVSTLYLAGLPGRTENEKRTEEGIASRLALTRRVLDKAPRS